MDYQSILARIAPFAKRHWLPLALISLSFVFLLYGLIGFLFHPSSPDVSFQKSAGDQEVAGDATQSAQVGNVVVDVEGAVVSPGVYHLGQSARVKDALVAAGGLSESANRAYVSKTINLAAKVVDGGKIYIPFAADPSASSGQASVESSGASTGSVLSTGTSDSSSQININTASSDSLDSLPGIGAVTIGKIVSGRPYQTTQELVDRKIVTQKVFDKIKDQITAY